MVRYAAKVLCQGWGYNDGRLKHNPCPQGAYSPTGCLHKRGRVQDRSIRVMGQEKGTINIYSAATCARLCAKPYIISFKPYHSPGVEGRILSPPF